MSGPLRIGLGLGLLPASVATPPTSVPVNLVAPSLAGFATEGQTLTCLPGSWSGFPSGAFSYQWKRNGTNIAGQTASTHVVATADVSQNILCAVVATNIVGPSTPPTPSNTVVPVAVLTISITPPPGTVGSSYSAIPAAAGGRGTKTFALTGTPPAGCSFNTATGEISSANLTTSGTASGLNITVTDADGLTASTGAFSITVSAGGAGGALDFSDPINSALI